MKFLNSFFFISLLELSALADTVNHYPAPVCFDAEICISKISQCVQPPGYKASYDYTLKTKVECVTYDGKVVNTSRATVKTSDWLDSSSACDAVRGKFMAAVPSCE